MRTLPPSGPRRGDSHPGATRREGFALAAAIVAIVVIGALIAGAFFASTQEFRIGRNSLVQQRAFAAAEYGLNRAVANFERSRSMRMDNGTTETLPAENVGAGGRDRATVSVTKLNRNTFMLVSEGVAGRGTPLELSRRTSVALRISAPDFYMPGALTTRADVTVTGTAAIDGHDRDPGGWDCDDIENRDRAGIAAPDGVNIREGGSGDIQGEPAVLRDPVAGDSLTYLNFGDQTWASLVANADVRLPAGANVRPGNLMSYWESTGRCQTTDPFGNPIRENWGNVVRASPRRPCEGYFPVVYVAGDLNVSNGFGQGILLVEGNLHVTGNFRYFGVVIVRGIMRSTGNGNHIEGGVMARGAELGSSTYAGNAEIHLSNCAIDYARRSSTPPTLATQRAWSEVF